ncbi:MAG: hypothetical protein JXR23_01010, partial [Pontiellaceae bacterium]|nr:hypothetical protein [Pontiellaceae bacterium]
DLESGQCLKILEGHSDSVSSVALSPDGRRAISGSSDKAVRVWDLDSGQCLAVYYPLSAVQAVVVDPCGKWIVCGTDDGQLHFLTLENFPPSGPFIITAANPERAQCTHCHKEFIPAPDVVAAIPSSAEYPYPSESFDDSRLLADCPHCAKPLKFNPFFLDFTADFVIEPITLQPPLQNRPSDAPSDRRQRAKVLVDEEKYGEAKAIYEELLYIDFEIPGTHCHLARIDLLTDNDASAASHADQAWSHRKTAPAYVLPRILWLKLAAGLLAESKNVNVGYILGQLKTTLQDEGAFMEWTMQPVLDHIKPRLSNHDHDLLSALIDAFRSPDNLLNLDRFTAWENACPQPLRAPPSEM